MRCVSVSELREGMDLARTIYAGDGKVLLQRNVRLNSYFISRLKELKIPFVYIKSDPDEDVEAIKGPVTQEVRAYATATLQQVLQKADSSGITHVKDLKKATQMLVDDILRNDDVIANIAEVRSFDSYTFEHSVNVCVLSLLTAKRLGWTRERLEELGMGALLHDTGKVFLPKETLVKPTKLTPEEYQMVQRHAKMGFDLLRGSIPLLASHVSYQHHERYDGSGYPRGLKGTDIHVFGRVVALADSFDAMTTPRAYQPRRFEDEAAKELTDLAGTLYDPNLLGAFLRSVALYPLGSTVWLNTGEVGEVVAATNETLTVRVYPDGAGCGETAAVSVDGRQDMVRDYVIDKNSATQVVKRLI